MDFLNKDGKPSKEQGKIVRELGWIKVDDSKDYYIARDGRLGRKLDENVYKLIAPKCQTTGYMQYNILMADGTRKYKLVHTLVAAAFIGPKPKNLVVNHKNGVKTDNRVENLEYVTRSENSKHAYRIGLQKPPMPNRNYEVLSDDAIKLIYECQSLTQTKLAGVFKISTTTVRNIKKGKACGHLTMYGLQLSLF